MAENSALNTFKTDITNMLARRGKVPGEIKSKEEELKGVTERGAEEVRGIQQMYGRGLEEEQRKYATGAQEARRVAGESMRDVAFTPTQENTKDLTQLFGMLTAAAFLTGGKGRQSGMGALAAMTGAMEGYRKGQKDVFDRELKEFDKRIREVQAHNQNVRNKLSDTLNTLKIDRDAGLAKLKSLEFEIQGSQAALALRRGDIQRGITYLNEEQKAINQAVGKYAEIEARGAQAERTRQEQERRHKETMKQRERIAAQKGAGGQAGMLKPGAEVTKNYLGTNALAEDMKDISTSLKDKGLTDLIKQYRLEAFASEEMGKIVAQIANEEIPSKLRQFLIKIRNIRNNYYLTISGKAVTGGEALRNYGVVPQPGDSAEVIKDKVDSMLNQLNRSIAQYQTLYGLPKLDANTINSMRAKGEKSDFDIRTIPVESGTQAMPEIPEGVPSNARYSPSEKSWWWRVGPGPNDWKSKKVE